MLDNIKIKATLLNMPSISLNGENIIFPYRKAEGFFYYLCVKKSVSRNEVISILWGNNDEKGAKKNLRDVIYKIKKIFGKDILILTGNSLISLNPQIDIEIDIEKINSENIISLYSGDFLSYFYIKNCLEFDNWCEEIRAYYKSMYINSLQENLEQMLSKKDLENIKKYAAILLQNDLYNEEVYRNLMQAYAECGQYNLAIKLYYELLEVLNEDLGESPDEKTEQLFATILALKETNAAHDNGQFFFGRYEEIFSIDQNFKNFMGGAAQSIIIAGEAGVGKTSLIDHAKQMAQIYNFDIIYHTCLYVDHNFYLKTWHSIADSMQKSFGQVDNNNLSIEQLQEKYGNLASHAINDIWQQLIAGRKVLLIIDDLQWADKASLHQLSNLLFSSQADNIILLANYRDDYSMDLEHFIVPLAIKGLVKEIYLSRFTFEETKSIVEAKKLNLAGPLIANIYKDTEGNALFITELLQVIQEHGYSQKISAKTAHIIKSRLIDLNKPEKDLLETISLYSEPITITELKMFFPLVELEIFEILENLMAKKLIKEQIINNDIYYSFTHLKIRDYVHESISLGRRQLWHKKIACDYEKEFLSDSRQNKSLYSKLIYHFNQSNDKIKTFHYKSQYLEDFYYMSHEVYPSVMGNLNWHDLSNDSFTDEHNLIKITGQIDALDDSDKQVKEIKMRIHFILGRYYIYSCEYDLGLSNIKLSLSIAEQLQAHNYIINNYKQMLFYGIQVGDLAIMRQYLDKIKLVLNMSGDDYANISHIMRLEGLYWLKQKQYDKARQILVDTIELIKQHNYIPTINLAACYNYLGNCYFFCGEPAKAFEYYDLAIKVCDQKIITNGLAVFYVNASKALHNLERFEEARTYNNTALEWFNLTNTAWGKTKAQMHAAKIELSLGNFNQAAKHKKIAKELALRLGNAQTMQSIEVGIYPDDPN